MRKITTAITAAALAFSMLAQAVPAAAVAGYDSAYAGESAFVNITAGQTQNFQVFFANTGTTSWVKGTGTQVDLAACLEDKVTCNAQDASEATWNNGWLSATRYTSTTQTTTPPGSLGTFSYNITAPTGVAAGIFRFNGDVVLASTGERIHPEGYYQEANTGGASGAPTITALDPTSGPVGENVEISGTGFICTPAFPTVSFGGTNAVVLSCGTSAIIADAPAHAPGAVTVTVSNAGSGASNGLTFTYVDATAPTFQSMTVSGDVVNVTFSEPVCGTYQDGDWTIQNISAGTTDFAGAGSSSNIPSDCEDAVATFSIFLTSVMPNGAFVEATLHEDSLGAGQQSSVTDAAAVPNPADAPQSRQATALAPESTKPTIVSATGAVGQPRVTLNFSEPVWCSPAGQPAAADFTVEDLSSTDPDPTVTAVGQSPTNTQGEVNGNACGITRGTADTAFTITLGSNLKADSSYKVNVLAGAATEIRDTVNNQLTVPVSVTFTSGAQDFTPPTLIDARISSNVGNSDFRDINDQFTMTFSEVMTDNDNLGTIGLQDQDGTVRSITCNGANVGCEWNDAKTMVTVTLVTELLPTTPETGTTPGMQVPFNVTAVSGSSFTDQQGNAVNVLGSSDRLVDIE